jgi:hypothetical protein
MPCRTDATFCGAGMRPPSVAITVIGSPVLSASLYERETEALRKRKR